MCERALFAFGTCVVFLSIYLSLTSFVYLYLYWYSYFPNQVGIVFPLRSRGHRDGFMEGEEWCAIIQDHSGEIRRVFYLTFWQCFRKLGSF